MKEPSMETLLLIAYPVGFAAAAVLFFSAQMLTPASLQLFQFRLFGLHGLWEIAAFLFIFILFNIFIVIAHEGVHALCFPEGLRSDHVGFGFHKNGAFFAFYTEDLSKRRMIVTMLMPFILFTMVPWLLIILFNLNIPLLMMALLYHALLASGDLVGLFLIIKNTPKSSVLKNKGYYTYYR